MQYFSHPITHTYILHEKSSVFKTFLQFIASNFMCNITRSLRAAKERTEGIEDCIPEAAMLQYLHDAIIRGKGRSDDP
jgi:hypothetical protein